jgi:hypothetical protein
MEPWTGQIINLYHRPLAPDATKHFKLAFTQLAYPTEAIQLVTFFKALVFSIGLGARGGKSLSTLAIAQLVYVYWKTFVPRSRTPATGMWRYERICDALRFISERIKCITDTVACALDAHPSHSWRDNLLHKDGSRVPRTKWRGGPTADQASIVILSPFASQENRLTAERASFPRCHPPRADLL